MLKGGQDGFALAGPPAALAACWLAAFSLSCIIATRGAALPERQAPRDTLSRLLGSSRKAFGNAFYERADLYFHKGVGHREESAFENRLFQRWAEAIRPSLHRHAEGEEVIDIMPWLALAARFDPGHLEAQLTAAYWLANDAGRPDAALRVLMDARRAHPGDYRPLIEETLIRMLLGQADAAAAALEAGLRLWPGSLDPEDEDVRRDLTGLLGMRAFLHLLAGETPQALLLLRRELDLRPNHRPLRERIARIEDGRADRTWAQRTWDELYGQRRDACDHDHHGHPPPRQEAP